METLDTPIKLSYNNGNNFPPNMVIIAYVILAVSVFLSLIGSYVFGLILFILSILTITNRHFVIIDPDHNFIHDYSSYLGFIKIGKKYPLDKYMYVTAMPLIESQQVYASTSNSTTISSSYTIVTFFGERFKGKRIISKFDSKNEAIDTAKKLGDRLSMKFFDYDPKLVRQVLLGQRSI